MKTIVSLLGILCFFGFGIVASEHNASAVSPLTVQTAQAPAPDAPRAPEMMKSCTHDSECPYGGCTGGACGSCSNNSDCKGYGECDAHQCGGCSNNSDCGKFGECNSHRCSKSPY